MRWITIFIALFIIRKSLQMVQVHEDQVPPFSQLSCVKVALKKYFYDRSNLLLYSKNSSNIVTSLFRVPLFFITQWNPQRKSLFGEMGTVVIILDGNATQDFVGLEPLQDLAIVQPVLVVCITNGICASDMYMDKIMKMVSSTKMHYVAINEQGIIDLYEYTTTAQDKCGIPQLLRCGRCSDKLTAKKVFRNRINYHQCPIRVITWPCPPYSQRCRYDDWMNLCGIEGTIMRVIAQEVNATPEVLTVQTPLDVRLLVAKGYADLGLGKMFMYHNAAVSTSRAYLFLKVTVIASHSTWQTSGGFLRNIALPLQIKVWVCFGLVIIGVVISRLLLPPFREIEALEIFGMFIGIPVLRQPRDLPNRIYYLSLVLFAYFCSQLYFSDLTRILSTNHHQKIKTLNDLEKSDIQVKGTVAARKWFKADYPRIYKDFKVMDYVEYNRNLQELLEGRSDSAFYVEGSDESFAQWKALGTLEDDISWYPVAMVAPISTAIMETTNEILDSVVESGIVREYVDYLAAITRSTEYTESFSDVDSEELNFYELLTVFLLLVFGNTLSFFVFLIEILIAFLKTKTWFKRKDSILPKCLRQRRVLPGLPRRRTSLEERN